MRLMVFLIIGLFWLPLNGQDFENDIRILDKNYLDAEAITKSDEVLTLENSIRKIVDTNFTEYILKAREVLTPPSPAVAFLIYRQGVNHYLARELDLAYLQFNEALTIRKTLANTYKENLILKNDLANNYFTLGVVLKLKGKYREAISSFQEAHSIYAQTGNKSKQARCLHLIGQQHSLINNLFEAEKCLEKARKTYPGIGDQTNYCIDMGATYRKLKEFVLADQFLTHAIKDVNNTEVWMAHKELGDNYDQQSQFKQALNHFQLALNKNSDSSIVLNSIGTAYMKMEEFDIAESYFNLSHEIAKRTNPNSKEPLNIYYHNMGELYLRQLKFETAINFFDKAISILKEKSKTDNSNTPNFLKDYEFKGKSYYQWYLQKRKQEHLDSAYIAYKVFNQLMDKMQREYKNEESELFWLNEFYSTIETGLSVAYAQYNQSNADRDFQFILSLMEQNKANILLENLKRNNALDSTKEIRIPSIQEIKDNLTSENSALFNFFVGDDSVTVVCITAFNHNVYRFPSEGLDELTQNLFETVTDEKSDAFHTFTKNSNQIYSKYLSNIINDLPSSINELIIIPDGPFSHLQFDLLLKDAVSIRNWTKMPYLLKDYAITYGYSASVLIQHQSKLKGNVKMPEITGFAPEFKNYECCGELNNKKELTHIAKHFSIRQYNGAEALRDSFISRFKEANILHLATHAKANSNNPDSSCILLSDSLVYLNEIYAQSSKASMVVLSACETGVGQLKRGEGVFSLARAFTNAGIPSTTMSMWEVGDQAASQLIDFYYQYLSEGYPKHKALQKAKLDYLEWADNEESAGLSRPENWAVFVHYGDTAPIAPKGRFNLWWLVLFAIGLLVGFVFFRKRSAQSN